MNEPARQRRVGLDLSPLRVSERYRRLYAAGFITAIGSQATYVTVAYQLKNLTHSTLAVGAVGLIELVPLIVFGLYGGVLADFFNRRKMVISAEAGLMLTSLTLLLNGLLRHPHVAVLYVVVSLTAVGDGLQRPSLEGLVQQSVPHELQRAASTLGMFRYTFSSIVGPSLGGLLAASVGVSAVYGLDVATYLVSLVLLFRVAAGSHVRSEERPSWAALFDGVRYAVGRRDLLGTYVIDLAAMILAFPIVMLPFVAERFAGHYALSLLYAATPLGAMIASLTARWTGRVHHYGRAVAVAASLWGLGIALFGWSRSLPLVLVGLVVAGGADAISAVFRSTMWNQSIPPDVRGRMAGIELLSYSVGPTLGQFRSGAMAAALTLRASLTIGGLACAGTCVALPLALPQLWRFDARTDENVAVVAALRAQEA